jgi:energy-coupling factor transport system ATP-binding protein
VETTLTQLGIAPLAQRDPLTLSGGEMQKMAIASLLVLDPAILVLDEPTSQLDPSSSAELMRLLRNLKGKKTLILIEHKMAILPPLADKVLALQRGQMLFAGSVREAFSTGRLIEEGIGAPEWTLLAHRWVGRGPQTLPWSYRAALQWFRRGVPEDSRGPPQKGRSQVLQ